MNSQMRHLSKTLSHHQIIFLAFGLFVISSVAQTRPAVPPLYGPAGITPQAVRQGDLASCYFHASIAAIASRNPSVLRSAIKANSDGTYTVRLVDGETETVELDDAMFGRLNHFDRSDGLWVSILLRGVAQLTMRGTLIAAIDATPFPDTAKSAAESIVRSNDTLLLAYDRAVRSAVTQSGDLDRDSLRTALNHQFQSLQIPIFFSKPVLDFLDAAGFFEVLAQGVKQNGAPTVASTGPTIDHDMLARIRSRDGGPDWWVPTHAYTVLAYDAAADRVTLRNPWGEHPAPGGVFIISISDFAAAYGHIDIVTN